MYQYTVNQLAEDSVFTLPQYAHLSLSFSVISGSVTVLFEMFCGGRTWAFASELARPRAREGLTHAPGQTSYPQASLTATTTTTATPFTSDYMEMMKICKQTSPKESYLAITRRLTAEKGLAAVLDGFLPWGFLQSLTKGAVFGAGEAFSRRQLMALGLDGQLGEVLGGGCGGLIQGYFMSPLLLLKTRVMTDPVFRTSGGVLATATASARVGGKVIADEGFAALMKGSGTFAVKRFLDWTTRYFFAVTVENLMRKDPAEKLTQSQKLAAGFAGGVLSALVTIPVDVLVATFQSHANAGAKVSVLETFRAQENVVEFATRGLMARVIHVAATTMLMKQASSMVYQALYPHER